MKLKISFELSLFLFGMVVLFGCDYYDDRFEITNKRNFNIAVETFLDSIPTVSEASETEYYLREQIHPNESKRLIEMGSTKGWSFRIKRSNNNRLNLFVFRVDSLRKYGVDSLIEKRIYDKYILSEAELDKQNWKVTFE